MRRAGHTPCRSWRRTICTSRLRTRPRSSRKASLPSGRPGIDGLTEELGKRLREQGMQPLFENIELPLCPVLAHMEHDGILVDAQALP